MEPIREEKLRKKAERLEKELAEFKAGIDEINKILAKIGSAEQEDKDKEELKKIEAQME